MAAFEAENGRKVVQEPPAHRSTPPAPQEVAILDAGGALPAPATSPAAGAGPRLAVRGAAGRRGVLLVGAPGVLRLSADVGLILGVAAIAGGVVMLVSRMRDSNN